MTEDAKTVSLTTMQIKHLRSRLEKATQEKLENFRTRHSKLIPTRLTNAQKHAALKAGEYKIVDEPPSNLRYSTSIEDFIYFPHDANIENREDMLRDNSAQLKKMLNSYANSILDKAIFASGSEVLAMLQEFLECGDTSQ